MATDRASIIRRAVSDVPVFAYATVDGVSALTASDGEPRALVDGDFLFGGSAKSVFDNWWLYRPDAATTSDRKRLIHRYDSISQKFFHSGPDYSVAPSEGEAYLVLKDDPDLWNRALNVALREECFFVRFDEFTPTDAERRIYQIDSSPISISDLDAVTQVWGIEWHNANDETNEELWRRWADGRKEWHVYEDEGTMFLDFRLVRPNTNHRLRLITTHAFSPLTDEDTETDVDERWAASATILVMARWLGDEDNPSDEWQKAGRRALRSVRDRRRAVLREYAYRSVGRENTFMGGAAVAGRAGR